MASLFEKSSKVINLGSMYDLKSFYDSFSRDFDFLTYGGKREISNVKKIRYGFRYRRMEY